VALAPNDRRKMLGVRLCGPQVIARLEAAGVRSFRELAYAEPEELVLRVNLAAGRPIWHPPMATQAMVNLIAAARRECGSRTPAPAERHDGPKGAPRRAVRVSGEHKNVPAGEVRSAVDSRRPYIS
jgi:hypothetical protein